MNVVYTDYAEETIEDRNISKRSIEETMHHPERVVTGKKGRKIAQKTLSGKLLRVVYETQAKTYIVITAYYTSPKRYMK